MKNYDLIDRRDLPEWFEYPRQFLRIYEQGLLDFDPWWILEGDLLRDTYYRLKKVYKSRFVVPFARTGASDDIACWEKGKGDAVVIVHFGATSGWESGPEYPDFWSFFRRMIDDTIEYDP